MFYLEEEDATCPQPSSVSPDPLAVTALEWDRDNGPLHGNHFLAWDVAPKLPLWQVLCNERL